MKISDCCGAATKLVTRVDHPYVYDDMYELRIPVLVCTKCGKVIEGSSTEVGKEDKRYYVAP